jgi:hypothetical protein
VVLPIDNAVHSSVSPISASEFQHQRRPTLPDGKSAAEQHKQKQHGERNASESTLLKVRVQQD